jgi:hypothetical protein
MPYRDPDPTDPSVLVGVAVPADAEAMREMAWVFAEEFARMGYDGPRILAVLTSASPSGGGQPRRKDRRHAQGPQLAARP